mgnify:CR=1 FL=1
MRKASDQMQEQTDHRMRMERRILAEQRGLVWFGGINTFKRLGLVVKARDEKTPFHWDKEVYSLSGGGGTSKLNKFVEGLLKFDADHSRPPSGCGLGDIEKYCHHLMEKVADIFNLQPAREKDVVPHACRKYFLRLETLTNPVEIEEYYSKLGGLDPEPTDNRMTYWTAKTVWDLTSLAPDQTNYLNGLEANKKLSSLAGEYSMHPLMVPWWTCLIARVVEDFGAQAARQFLRDENRIATQALPAHLRKNMELAFLLPSLS